MDKKSFAVGAACGVGGTLAAIAIAKVIFPLVIVIAAAVVFYLLFFRRRDEPSA